MMAEQPDLTVQITMDDPSAPGKLHWRCKAARIEGLPPKLSGWIDMGDLRGETAELFKRLAQRAPGKHETVFNGIGDLLWNRAPAMFRNVYWALYDHFDRPLTIQFCSNDAHLPWEFMRPSRDGQIHAPLALAHSVARWLSDFEGYMRPDLPAGNMLVVAPCYPSMSANRPKAELGARQLLEDYDAIAVPGTRAGMLEVLETPPVAPVALLYFSGHGALDLNAASSSYIKLENGEELSVLEVDRQEVVLGQRFGSAVFLNACEVGATGVSFGEVGGWAKAFAARHFRAFIAPLWAVDEEAASLVADQLVRKVLIENQTVAEALRQIRSASGPLSPTYYAYLLYGDVTARFGS